MSKPKIPPEPALSYRLCFPYVEHHATALGYVCISSAMLEAQVDNLISILLNCPDEARRAIVDASGESLQTRCELALKLATISAVERGMVRRRGMPA